MSESQPVSVPASIAVGAFGLLSLLGAWIVTRGNGFYHSPGKYAVDAVFIGGLPALLMAVLQFAAAALAFTWLLRQRLPATAALAIGFGVAFVPPLVYVIVNTLGTP